MPYVSGPGRKVISVRVISSELRDLALTDIAQADTYIDDEFIGRHSRVLLRDGRELFLTMTVDEIITALRLAYPGLLFSTWGGTVRPPWDDYFAHLKQESQLGNLNVSN